MKLYGLFKYTYEYDVWEELQVASSDESKLREWAANNFYGWEVFTLDEHKIISSGRGNKLHLLIKEIDVL